MDGDDLDEGQFSFHAASAGWSFGGEWCYGLPTAARHSRCHCSARVRSCIREVLESGPELTARAGDHGCIYKNIALNVFRNRTHVGEKTAVRRGRLGRGG